MTLIANNDLIDYDYKWNDNLDSLKNYIVDDYDFTNDYGGFVIKVPTYKDFPFKSFSEFSKHLGIPELRQQLADGTIDQDEFDKKMNEFDYVNNFKKIPKNIKSHNKTKGGKYWGLIRLPNGDWDYQGSPSNDINVVANRIKKYHKDSNKISYVDVNGNTQEFSNQAKLDEFKAKESNEVKIKSYGQYGATYKKYHTDDGLFKQVEFSSKLGSVSKKFDAYTTATHPDLPASRQNYSGSDSDIEAMLSSFTSLKVIEIGNDGSQLETLFNWTFGQKDIMNLQQVPIQKYHPAKLEVLTAVLKEIRRAHPHIESKYADVITKAENFLKSLNQTNYKKVLNVKEKIKEKNESQTVINKVGNVVENVLYDAPQWFLSTIVGGSYDKGDRQEMKSIKENFINSVNVLTTNQNGQPMSTDINGRSASKVRWALQNNQDMFQNVFESPTSFMSFGNNVFYYDEIMLPVYQDLRKEYMYVNNLERFSPTGFMSWLQKHPDPVYSESKDNEFFSFYEMLQVGKLQAEKNGWNIQNAELYSVMNTNVDLVGSYNTTRLAFEEWEMFRRTRIHPNFKRPNTNAPDLWKHMIHVNPELVISYLQASKQNRSDGKGGFRDYPHHSTSFAMMGEYEESQLIRELEEAFGYSYNFYTLDLPFYPTIDDILPEYFDERFLEENTIFKGGANRPNNKIHPNPTIKGTVNAYPSND